jgi:CRP-like cAMP-binding protein
MNAEQRNAVEERERAHGALRALYLGQLAEVGRRRAAALREAEDQLQQVGRLLVNAQDVGISLSEIAREVDVSRPTLYQLRARYGRDPRDVRLAVLQSTWAGEIADQDIAEKIDVPVGDVHSLLREFEQEEWVGWDVGTDADGEQEMFWYLTAKGVQAIEGGDLGHVEEGVRE